MHRPPPKFEVEVSASANGSSTNYKDLATNRVQWSRDQPCKARILSNQRVTPQEHWQDVRLIKFDIEGSGLRCEVNYFVVFSRPHLGICVMGYSQKKTKV